MAHKKQTEKQIINFCIKNMTKQLNRCVKFIHANSCSNFSGSMEFHYSGMHFDLWDKILLIFKETIIDNSNNDYVAKMHNHIILFNYDMCEYKIYFLLD